MPIRSSPTAPAARPSEAAALLRRDPVLRGLFALAVLSTAWYASDSGGAAAQVVVSWVVQAGLDVGYVVFAWRIARLAGARADIRRFWRFLTVGGSFFLAGDTVQAVLTVRAPGSASANGTALQSLLVGAGVVCCVIGMLTHPARMTVRERLRFTLDAGAIMAAAAIFIWYFSVGARTDADRTGAAVSVVTAALMLVATFALVKLLLGGNPPFTRRAGMLGALAAALSGLATGLGPLLTASAYDHLGFAVRLVPCILIVATNRVQEIQFRADPGVLSRPRRRPYTLLPYAAVGATQALLILALLTGELTVRAWGVVGGVVLITALVVVRQLVAFSDNSRLLVLVRQQEERFRSLVQHASDITAVVRADGTVAYASPAVERVLGVAAGDVIGKPLDTLVHPTDHDALRGLLTELPAASDTGQSHELRMRHADGSWRWLGVVATNRLDDPSVGGIVCNARDVTESLEFRDRLRHEATHDPLTGLANRALFNERIRTASLRQQSDAAILLIDLDDFKQVNDTIGHHAGDLLLTAVGQRLLSCTRTVDTVARLGGDEFALFLPDTDADSGALVAQRILESFDPPVMCDGQPLTIKASIGVAAGPVADTDALLRTADATMYRAKRGGKGSVAVAASGRSGAEPAVKRPRPETSPATAMAAPG